MRIRTLLLPVALFGACSPRAGTAPAEAPRPVPTPEAPVVPLRAGPQLVAALADADTLRVAEVAPGVLHAYAWSAAGPWAINVLEIDGAVCARVLPRRACRARVSPAVPAPATSPAEPSPR